MKTNLDSELDIEEITLLSREEYEKYKSVIPEFNGWWWLRSPGYHQHYAAVVITDGSLFYTHVNHDFGCVRPAIKIKNAKTLTLEIKDKFVFAGNTWTMIGKNIALCNESIGICAFRRDLQSIDANIYEVSDVKKFIDNWANENGIFNKIKLDYNEWETLLGV